MSKNIIWTIIVLVVIFVLALIFLQYNPNSQSNNQLANPTNNITREDNLTNTPPNLPTENQNETKVSLINFTFNPKELKISQGTKVTWTNQDSTIHNLVADQFKSSNLNQGESFSHIFDQTGTFSYICSLHPNMAGSVIVE